jgi:hypothetical protein
MPAQRVTPSASAWYDDTRERFLETPVDSIAGTLALRAAGEHLDVEADQETEWRRSVHLLQENLSTRIPILREALQDRHCQAIQHVILEFDFRRRGLRMDCVLLAQGAILVVEFKRARLGRAEHDQVMNYAVNLLEFHRLTRDWCERHKGIVVPLLVSTERRHPRPPSWPGLGEHSWKDLANRPLECDPSTLASALSLALTHRRSEAEVDGPAWLASPFAPSSSILDATLSLYGSHDVAAIATHAAAAEAIAQSTSELRNRAFEALSRGEYHVMFLSGAPGAGKTLVGLDLVMRGETARQAVFVTGNAPLVDVLTKALTDSYRAAGRRAESWAPTGYRRKDAKLVASNAGYKIVKAHRFLGSRGTAHGQEDGRVLIFDEAQRTYEQGVRVLGTPLPKHEAELILEAQRKMFPHGGAVVIALIGHRQAINRGERGIVAWLEAADKLGWSFSIGDETLHLAELGSDSDRWSRHPRREVLGNAHLRQSMRYFRNASIELWAAAVLDDEATKAKRVATDVAAQGDTVWVTRSLRAARAWARRRVSGGQRAGLIASGQARRLAAEGLFVDLKPDIASWMLAPTADIRSSNALETVQNQYQVQGLELDYCIVCWDADLRREGDEWAAYKLSGSGWRRDRLLDVAKNGYRVLLTRARQGMVIFVPEGDLSGEDSTRDTGFYDGIWEFLIACGAEPLIEGA